MQRRFQQRQAGSEAAAQGDFHCRILFAQHRFAEAFAVIGQFGEIGVVVEGGDNERVDSSHIYVPLSGLFTATRKCQFRGWQN